MADSTHFEESGRRARSDHPLIGRRQATRAVTATLFTVPTVLAIGTVPATAQACSGGTAPAGPATSGTEAFDVTCTSTFTGTDTGTFTYNWEMSASPTGTANSVCFTVTPIGFPTTGLPLPASIDDTVLTVPLPANLTGVTITPQGDNTVAIDSASIVGGNAVVDYETFAIGTSGTLPTFESFEICGTSPSDPLATVDFGPWSAEITAFGEVIDCTPDDTSDVVSFPVGDCVG